MSHFFLDSRENLIPLSEQEIKQNLSFVLSPGYLSEGGRILHEQNICLGAARIDVLLLKSTLHGIEIKSDFDSLTRLKRQVTNYLQVVEYLTVISTPRHIRKISTIVPACTGLMFAYKKKQMVNYVSIREAKSSPLRQPIAIAQLLRKSEAVNILSSKGLKEPFVTYSRVRLWHLLAEHFSLEELTAAVVQRLKKRHHSEQFIDIRKKRSDP